MLRLLLAGLAFTWALPGHAQTAFVPGDWECEGHFEVDGKRVLILRHFPLSGDIRPYVMQTFGGSDGYSNITWTIAPEGHSLANARNLDRVLVEGPDLVGIGFPWRTQVTGPVYAHFWGDGAYAGSQILYNARQVRQRTGQDGTMGGLQGGLGQGAVLQALAGSDTWSFAVIDQTGKELVRGQLRPPDLNRSVAEYHRVTNLMEEMMASQPTEFISRDGFRCSQFEEERYPGY